MDTTSPSSEIAGSRSESPADVIGAPKDAWDPMQTSDRAVNHWTTTNLGEAVPGVMTPLGIALWHLPVNRVGHRVAHRMGVFSKAEAPPPLDPADGVLRIFYGRLTIKLEHIATIGDRMPGVTGEQVLASLFGKPPAGMTFHPSRRRYASIAWRLPRAHLAVPKTLARLGPEWDAWWRSKVEEIPSLDLAGSTATFADAVDRFEIAMEAQATAMFASFQPVFDMLERLVTRAGVGDLAILSGTGGAEISVVTDIWKASRGQMTVEDVVRNHGFHGPGEGEISSHVWREDPSPLRTVTEHYRRLPETDDPALKEAEKERKRVTMTKEVLAALPRSHRPGARLTMKLARERIPDRGRAKRSFLQAMDIARMSARRAGHHLEASGVLEHSEDVFYLTGEELTGELPRDVKELVRKRRRRRETYQRIDFRTTEWQGMPDAVDIAELDHGTDRGLATITGLGASAGIVEGLVRIVDDPTFQDVEPGEILVAPTTDPSWCSIMFVSAALVIDLGGMLSHAAVVARELEIPCVVNARDATKRLNTGDRVRVDGNAGTVEILERGGC
jgi:phosphohistidine swiveling domain-containing protein